MNRTGAVQAGRDVLSDAREPSNPIPCSHVVENAWVALEITSFFFSGMFQCQDCAGGCNPPFVKWFTERRLAFKHKLKEKQFLSLKDNHEVAS